MGFGRTFLLQRDAAETLKKLAQPACHDAAEAMAAEIPAHVPVVDGVAVRTYKPEVHDTDTGAAVTPGSFLWHWLEYGTAYSPAYRPIENAARALGLHWVGS